MSLGRNTLTAVLAMILMTILLGVIYPLAITGISQVLFPGNSNGQRIYHHGRLVGSKIIGQSFRSPVMGANGKPEEEEGELVTEADPRYFQSRPSATEPPYNAAASTFSNLGPNNKATKEEIEGDMKEYLELNKPYDHSLTKASIPVDAANSSASGLDPYISVRNADIQAHRIAAIRHLSLSQVMSLISANTHPRSVAIFGESGVNVLELNLALDGLAAGRALTGGK